MAKTSHVIGVLVVSLVIVAGLGWWVEQRNAPPEILLQDEEIIPGPLTAEELEVNQPEITNTMNRIATFDTNQGVIKIELFEDQMPITTSNFISLVEDNFYDGTKFHRVIKDFMIQGGDPNSKGDNEAIYGQGGPSENVQDEFVAGELLTNTRGTISMANTGQPNSGGSQFFINTVDNLGLDFDKEPAASKHPVFGRVVEGMEIVDTISKVEVIEPAKIPENPIVVNSITIGEQ